MDYPILYIHGFGSSGHSGKAQVLQQHFPRVFSPSLPHQPQLALETLQQFIRALNRPPLLVGSSLGGFYALNLSVHLNLPAVLINPVVHFDLPLAQYIGLNQSHYDGSRFEFTHDHLLDLKSMAVEAGQPSKQLLLLQMGDDLLDHHETLRRLPHAESEVEEGGDHGYQNLERHIERIDRFARKYL